jgi:anti-anti-sigma factor
MDSSGLGVLVGAHKRLVRLGGRLRVVGASTAVTRLLTITGLDRVFDIIDEAGTALTS